jgi:hypothetical protein
VRRFGGEEKGSFHSSKGWFESVKKWMSLCNVKKIWELVSADCVAGTKYPEKGLPASGP